MNQSVVVATFRTRLDAESAGGLLEGAGIAFLIQSAEAMGMGPLPQGASLLVRADELEAAKQVLVDAGIIKDSA